MKITFHHDNRHFVGPGGFLTRVIVMSLAAMLAAYLLPGIQFDSFAAVVITAIVIALLNNFIRPILIVVTLPFLLLSMGLFLFVVNAIVILLADSLVSGFHVASFGSALLFGLLLTLFNYLLELPNRMLYRQPYRSPHDSNSDEFTPYEEVE